MGLEEGVGVGPEGRGGGPLLIWLPLRGVLL